MMPMSKDKVLPDHQSKVQFNSLAPENYDHFLALKDYAFPDGMENFILPIDDSNDALLAGAPEAFVKNRTSVIDNTAEIKFARNTARHVVKAQKAYFKRKGFKSFASLVILGEGGNPLGIVNIECNQRFIFGKTEEEKNEVSTLLHPFCSLLALVVK